MRRTPRRFWFLLAFLFGSGIANADPPLSGTKILQAGTTVVPTTHNINYVSGCTVVRSGSQANVTCAGGGVFDVKTYGAVGDGVTDDTAAFNTTVAAVIAAGGGTILVPTGHFYIAGAVSIIPNAQDDQNIEYMGTGSNSQIWTTINSYPAYVGAVGTFWMHGLTIRPQSTAELNAVNVQYGVAVISGERAEIENNLFIGLRPANGGGIIYTTVGDVVVHDNEIGDSVIFGSGGLINLGTILTAKVYNNKIADFYSLGGKFWGTMTGYGAALAGVIVTSGYFAGDVSVYGNWFDEGSYIAVNANNPGLFRVLNVYDNFNLVNITSGGRFVYANTVPNVYIQGNSIDCRSTTEPSIEMASVTSTVIDSNYGTSDTGGTFNLKADSSCTAVYVRETNFSSTQIASAATMTRFVNGGVESLLRVTNGAVVVNTLVKEDATNDNQVIQLGTSDVPALVVGVALDAAGGAATNIRVAQVGQIVTVKSDGSATITKGQKVGVSGTSAGRVKQIASGNQVGIATTSAAASADALVSVYIWPSAS